MSGLDTEADGNVKAGSWMLELSAQRHPIVDLLREDQRRVHLNHWTGPAAQAHSQRNYHSMQTGVYESLKTTENK